MYDYSEGSTNTYLVTERHQLIAPCMACGKESEVLFNGDKYFAYFMSDNRPYIQDVWPKLTPEQRDHIMTGIHPECSVAFYGEED